MCLWIRAAYVSCSNGAVALWFAGAYGPTASPRLEPQFLFEMSAASSVVPRHNKFSLALPRFRDNPVGRVGVLSLGTLKRIVYMRDGRSNLSVISFQHVL